MPREYGFEFDEITKLCNSFGLVCKQVNADTLEVVFSGGIIFYFANIPEEKDTAAGFYGTLWHYHGNLMLQTGDSTYVEYDEIELLRKIVEGDVLVVTQYIDKKIEDRWLIHKQEMLDTRFIEENEELCVSRLA